MINEITCNSNNTIELSRGELLQWINSTLRINYAKIEQMGTGAAYCQLLDLIYPGKVPMTKVNWKARHEYQYVQNFKVLQQSFVKLNIMRHVDVQKLVKCRYQDNLQFLQWFKKIFDTTSTNKEYDPVIRRGDKIEKQKVEKNQKQNKLPAVQQSYRSTSAEKTAKSKVEDASTEPAQVNVERESPRKAIKFLGQSEANTDNKLIDLLKENHNQQKMFYLRKISEIEHLMQEWDTTRTSPELMSEIRKIILVAPETEWAVENGEYIESLQRNDSDDENY